MSYKVGDIVLVRFPFTDFSRSKKRPVLVVRANNKYNDVICFQVTSNSQQSSLIEIKESDIISGKLPKTSYVKFEKCFTIDNGLIEKQIATIHDALLVDIKNHFCDETF